MPVAEHVTGMVEDDVQNHVDTQVMGRVHQVDEVLAGAEMRVHVEEILDAITVVGV